MKKRLMLGLTGVVMLFALAGCGKVKICKYKGIEATKVTFDVSDEEVQETVLEGMYDYATYDEITDRGIQEGDYVIIDYLATLDGKKADAYSSEEEEVCVGGGYIYPEVEEALIGMKKEESKTVEFKLTEEFAEEGDAGKQLSMEVKVKEITEEKLPEYNESFVKENLDFDTIAEYEESVKADLLAEKEENYKYNVTIMEIFAYIAENSTFEEYPKDLYKKCEKDYNSMNESYAAMFGMELEEFLAMNGITEDAKKQEINAMVEQELIISEIAKKEKITCSDEEVTKYVNENYEAWGFESTDAFFEEYTKEEMKDELLYQKVAEFLYENAKFKEISEEEYLASQEEEFSEENADDVEADDAESEE